MRDRGDVLLVAVGRLGRAVLDAGRRLGVALPGHVLLAPGDPVPPDVRASGGAIVVLDAEVSAGEAFFASVRTAVGGAPVAVLAVGDEREGACAAVGSSVWLALPREGGVEEAAALLAAGLHAGDVRLPERGQARFARVDLEPARPRDACAALLAARCAERLLADLPGAADPAALLASMSPAWAILLGGDVAPGDTGGLGYPALADAMADPVAPVAAAFAAGTLRARDVAKAAREAVAGLGGERTAVPLTVLAGDLDRALGAQVASGGVGAGRALVSALLKVAVARGERPGSGERGERPGMGERGELGDQFGREFGDQFGREFGDQFGREFGGQFGDECASGKRDDLEAVLLDLERRARSMSLAITFTKRSALLSGVRDLADAARRQAARQATLPATEPIVAMLESRWARLDAVEDALAALCGDAGAGAGRQASRVRDEDYLGSLPDGEEAAIDALLREPGLGPALLSGDLPGFLAGRATARFFAWVPERSEASPLEEIERQPGLAGERPVAAAVSGIPGSLPAGQALELARKLGAGCGIEPIAVPVEASGVALVVRVSATLRPRASSPAATEERQADAVRFAAEHSGRAGTPAAPGLAPSTSYRESDLESAEPGATSDDGFWAAFRGLIARARPVYDDPALALEGLYAEAPLFRLDAGCRERQETLAAELDSWRPPAGGPRRLATGAAQDQPQASLDAALEYAHLWEDRLHVWDFRHAAAADAEMPRAPRNRAPLAASREQGDDLPPWLFASAPEPRDPLAEMAELAAIGLATHLITHVEGYLAYTYAEDNGLIHTAILAPADDPAGTIAGLLANPEALPLLRRDANARLDDPRFHDAIRSYAHDLGAEVATRDWLRMPVNPYQRLLADRGLAVIRVLPEVPGGKDAAAVEPPASEVPWDAGMVLPGLAKGGSL